MRDLTYSKVGDYNIPNLKLPQGKNHYIGKYGRMRECYLKEHRRVTYINLLTTCELQKHLYEIDVQCNEMVEQIVSNLAYENNATEQLKATEQMEWVGIMNSFKSQAEETVYKEIIYT